MRKLALVFMILLGSAAVFAQAGPPIVVGQTPIVIYAPAKAAEVTIVQTAGASKAYVIYTVNHAVLANKVAGSTYTFSPAPAQFFNQGQPVGFISVATGSATFTATAVGGSSVVVSGTSGDTAYYSGPTQISPGTVVLDMAGIAGANLGAKMNNCVAQLPSHIGVCKGDNLTGAQTLSTAVTVTAPASVVFTFCGQAISQSAAISGDGYSVEGCPSKTTTFTKSANIDMMTISGLYQQISDITLTGNRPTNTGDGIVLSGATNSTINDVVIQGVTGSSINCSAGVFNYLNSVKVFDFGTHALLESGCITYVNYAHMSDTQVTAVATGTTVDITGSESIYTGGSFDNSSGFGTIVINSGGSPTTFDSVNIQNFGGFEALILGGAGDIAKGLVVFGGGASHATVVSANAQISNSFIDTVTAGSDGVTLGAQSRFENNKISFAIGSVSGKCAVNILGESIGAYVGHNNITSAGTGSNPNYGVCITTVAANHSLTDIVEANTITWSDSTNSAAVRFDNTAAVVTGINDNRFINNNCIHIHFCISRVDTGNSGTNYYENNQGDPTATFDSGGSTKDVIVQLTDSVGITFAALPIAGNGSQVYCTDCTQGVPAGSGAGGLLLRNQSTWETMPSPVAPTVSSGFGTGAAVVAGGIPSSFQIGVGTSNTGTGIIALPVAKTGWSCTATDITTTSTTVSQTKPKATGSDSSHVALQNYTDISGTAVWVDSDILNVSCFPR